MKKIRIAMVFNIIPKVPSAYLQVEPSPMGGWLMSMVEELSKNENLIIDIISPGNINKLVQVKDSKHNYFVIPEKNNKDYWTQYIEKNNPDIIHLNGTEFIFTDDLFVLDLKAKVIISIQGIISEIAKYYRGGLNTATILKNLTLKDILRRSTIFNVERKMKNTSKSEVDKLKKADIIIGRTDWDKGFIKTLGLEKKYRHVNENLRNGFYESGNRENRCIKPYTIFCSQAAVPYKGIHFVFEALPIVKKIYPEVTVRIAGHNLISRNTLKNKVLMSGYGRYLNKLIKKNNLYENIKFIGLKTEKEIISELNNAQIFVQSSVIENSPNSLGEAMILGIPAIATDVGGTNNYITNNYNGFLYNHTDSMILAAKIIELFENESLAKKFSENSIRIANKKYDRNENAKALSKIYYEILISY